MVVSWLYLDSNIQRTFTEDEKERKNTTSGSKIIYSDLLWGSSSAMQLLLHPTERCTLPQTVP